MDAAQLQWLLGVIVVLAGFWAYIQTQFLRKDVADAQAQRINEKLTDISTQLSALSLKMDSTIVKSTINELADKLIELHREDRLQVRSVGGR